MRLRVRGGSSYDLCVWHISHDNVDGVTHCESLIRGMTADIIKIILRKGVTDSVWEFVSQLDVTVGGQQFQRV